MATHRVESGGAYAGVSANTYILSSTNRSSSVTTRRTAGTTAERPLNPRQVRAAWETARHPFVRMCMNEKTKRLFTGRGVIVHRGDEPQVPTPLFETFLRRDMVPLAREAFVAIEVLGVAAIAFRRPKTAGLGPDELVPYVPPPLSYTITTWADAGVQRFGFYWHNHTESIVPSASFGEPDTNVIIAHDFGFEPRIDGTLTSNMHVIATELATAHELRTLMLVGERIASNPPLISTYNHAAEASERAASSGARSSYFASGDADSCANREQYMYDLTSSEQTARARQIRGWSAMTGMDPHAEFGDAAGALNDFRERYTTAPPPVDGTDFSGAEMPWARRYRLSPTDLHVSHPMPSTRSDYTAIMHQTMEIVCGVLNVPQGVLASSTTVKAGVEAVAEAMHRTVNQHADQLSALMTGIYNHIFGAADLRDELRSRADRRRRSKYDLAPQLLTDADLFEARERTRVRLSFDLSPPTTVETLDFFRNRGLISWRTYGEAALRLNGFSGRHLDSATDPFTPEERKAMVLGKANPALTETAGEKVSASTKRAHKQASSGSSEKEKTAKPAKKRARTETK